MRNVRKAFTLVEILIVVVILGILAAIVVPQFTSATRDAQGGNIQAQLETLNSQAELFRAKYNQYPSQIALTPWTDDLALLNGQTITGGLVGAGLMKDAPRNPVNNSAEVAGAAGPEVGWVWLERTVNGRVVGQYFANFLNQDPTDNDPTSTDDGGTSFGQVIDPNFDGATIKLPAEWTE